jgi:uncharacterized protein YjbI with pentapeptide repeats
MKGINSCHYKFEDGQGCQKKTDKGDDYCIFHNDYPATNEEIKRFWWRLKRLMLKDDGDWRGFNFPSINLESITCPVSVTATCASFQDIKLTQVDFEKGVDISKSHMTGTVELQRCNFTEKLSLKEITFPNSFSFGAVVVEQGFFADNAVFDDDFKVSGTFKNIANFSNCHFNKKAEFVQTKNISVSGSVTLTSSFASGNAVISLSGGTLTKTERVVQFMNRLMNRVKSSLKKFINWMRKQSTKYWKALIQWIRKEFISYRLRLPHKRAGVTKYVLFDEKAILDNMTFSKPKSVLFKGVDLRNATFGGTDLRGVTFIGNDWYQPKLKRNGLKEELRYFELKNYYDQKEWLPNIENTCRNIRFSLEEFKDFGLANDFFVGEMEARRRQLIWYKRWLFSVLTVYKIISHYGTSSIRCGLVFLLAVMCHGFIISYLVNPSAYAALGTSLVSVTDFSLEGITQWFCVVSVKFSSFLANGRFMDFFTYSLQTMTLQKDKVALLSSEELKLSSISFVNTMFTIIGPILVGLLALTVRTRIKRN